MKENMFYGASKLIFQKAEELRKNMTPAEEIMWGMLKGNQFEVKFRRQHPLFLYIADFYCHELKLVIEIDGSIHDIEDVKINDSIRENDLKEFTLENLYINGLSSQNDRVKILGNGAIKAKLAFKVNAVSEKAKAAIEAAGGTVEIVK